jgi:hypothetical protein
VTDLVRVYQNGFDFSDDVAAWPTNRYGIGDPNSRLLLEQFAAEGKKIILNLKEGLRQQNHQWKEYDNPAYEETFFNASGTLTINHGLAAEAGFYGVKAFDATTWRQLLPATEINRAQGTATFQVRPEDVGRNITIKIATEYGGSSQPIDNDATDGYSLESWDMFAELCKHWAAIYGPGGGTVTEANKTTELRMLDESTPVGQDVLYAFQINNEMMKTWYRRRAYWYPEEQVVMMEACYRAIKEVAPTLPVWLGPSHEHNGPYLESMHLIALEKYGRIPWDGIAGNHYSNDAGGEQHGSATRGVSPENDVAFLGIQAYAEIRNRWIPNGELSIGEFGYDTNTNSYQKVSAIGTLTQQQVQAAWILRSYLRYMTLNSIDKVFQFMIRDVGEPGTGFLYGNSGFTTSLGNGLIRKFSWYTVHAFVKRLGEYTWQGQTVTGANNDIYIQHFTNDAGDHAYVVWHGTESDKRTDGFSVPVDASITQAKQVSFAMGSNLGVEDALTISGNAVSVDVSEMPIIIMEGVASGITITQTYAVTSGAAVGTPVADIQSTENNVTFSLSGADANLFTVNVIT